MATRTSGGDQFLIFSTGPCRGVGELAMDDPERHPPARLHENVQFDEVGRPVPASDSQTMHTAGNGLRRCRNQTISFSGIRSEQTAGAHTRILLQPLFFDSLRIAPTNSSVLMIRAVMMGSSICEMNCASGNSSDYRFQTLRRWSWLFDIARWRCRDQRKLNSRSSRSG